MVLSGEGCRSCTVLEIAISRLVGLVGGGGNSLEILDSSLPSPYFSCVSDGRLFPSFFFFFLSHYLIVSFSPELEKRFVFQQTKTFEFFFVRDSTPLEGKRVL